MHIMHFFFIDDSKQNHPSREGMGPLCAIGGLAVDAAYIRVIETRINEICEASGFPEGEKFKWSPGGELWMRDHLVGDQRREFFLRIINLVCEYNSCFFVMIEDTQCRTATGLDDHEVDCVNLFLERAQGFLGSNRSTGIVIAERPGGDRQDEECFLEECYDTFICGTNYLIPDRIILNVLPVAPKFVRLLQVADLITSCTLAFVSGEDRYSPPVFERLRDHFHTGLNGIAGSGIKIHPDYRYANLYYWLFGLEQFVRGGVGVPMPLPNRPYFSNPLNI
jgi:hypothetical protein